MMKDEQLVEIVILGQPYQVKVKGSPERAKRVSELVNEIMENLQKGTKSSDTTRLAILASLNLADKLLDFIDKEREKNNEFLKVSEELNRIFDEAIENRKV